VIVIRFTQNQFSLPNSPFGYYSGIFIVLGIIYIFNFLRPIINIYAIYVDLNWAEFQILELFDILNFLFGFLLILLGLLFIYYEKSNKTITWFGGIVFLLFNFLNPSHFLIFWGVVSILFGNPPVWINVIPPPLFTSYLTMWSILSTSYLLLQSIGIILAIQIILNKNPLKGIFQYLLYYCWVIGLTGVLQIFHSIFILGMSGSWTAISITSYIFQIISWVSLIVLGYAGLHFISRWNQHNFDKKTTIYGQIALIAYNINYLIVSFSDITMKIIPILVLICIFSFIIGLFTFKLPAFLQIEKVKYHPFQES